MDAFGRLDVVVNNAGHGDVAPFEQLSSERFRAVVDTNFYGVVNVTRAALPIMRKQQSGCMLQISSLGGRLALPGSAPYHAAKWAVGGFTESLAQEVAPFGVKMCALEPGGMRTNWGIRAHQDVPELLPDYEPSVGAIVKALHSLWGQENSDPVKVAQIILRLADSDHLPAHLLLAATRSSMPSKPRRRARRMENAGEKLASRLTSMARNRCLHCNSDGSHPDVSRAERPHVLLRLLVSLPLLSRQPQGRFWSSDRQCGSNPIGNGARSVRTRWLGDTDSSKSWRREE
jgi:short-subunit dehydrogenase